MGEPWLRMQFVCASLSPDPDPLGAFGVDEPLDETAFQQGLVVRGSHYLILSDGPSSARRYRPLAQQLYKQPQISFIPTTLPFAEWKKLYKTEVK